MDVIESRKVLECCNCLQAAIYNFCEKTDVNPLFILINGFSIDYGNKEGDYIWEKIRINTSVSFETCFAKTCGIEFKEISLDLSNLDESFFSDSDGLLVRGDAFFCPWNDAFHKSHISHFFIARSYDRKCEALVCEDPYLKKKEVYWPVSVLNDCQYKVYKIEKVRRKRTLTIKNVYLALFADILAEDIRDNYKRFVNDLHKITTKKELFENDNPSVNRINICMKQMADCYKGLALVFDYIEEAEEHKDIYDLLIKAKNIWSKLNYALIRMSIKSDQNVGDVDWMVDILAEAERIDIEILDKVRKNLR